MHYARQALLQPYTIGLTHKPWVATFVSNKQVMVMDISDSHRSLWEVSRAIIGYVAATSLLVLVGYITTIFTSGDFVRRAGYIRLNSDHDIPAGNEREGRLKRHIHDHGGPAIFTFQVSRAVSTVSLVVLAIFATSGPFPEPKLALLYASLLALATVLLPAKVSRVTSSHTTVVLFAFFVSYAYRDIWPLLTFTLQPADLEEGPVLWVKVALAFFGGVAIPLLEPYPYIPLDPKNPQIELNEEQTASLFTFYLYLFLDPVIRAARRVSHLPADQFPALADYDRTDHLVDVSFEYLDPFKGARKGRNIFWGLCLTFKWRLLNQLVLILFNSGTKMGLAIGTYKLLDYLENNGEDAIVQPWVWIVWIAVAPLVNASFSQMYLYHASAMLVRVEAIITSLVFEHSLRIRFKAETTSSTSESASTVESASTSVGPDSAASAVTINESAHPTGTVGSGTAPGERLIVPLASPSEDIDEATLHARSETGASSTTVDGSTSGNNKKTNAKKQQTDVKEKKSVNLVGRINNLVTSDLASIGGGRDFLVVFVSAPLTFSFGMVFLYNILGWSALVGLAVMLVLLPVPAKGAKLMIGVEKKKMEATDARVKVITETMSMLRMVKLFGWEERVQELIEEKRVVELEWVWKRKMLRMATGILNFTIPLIHMIVSYGIYTMVMKRELTAAVVFSSLTGFDLMRANVMQIIYQIPSLIAANVSLKRIQDFLNETELLDSFDHQLADTSRVGTSIAYRDDIGISNASFTWSSSTEGTITPSRRTFRLRIDDELVFKPGAINLIIGATGSGKTSLLMALLGEMHYMPNGLGAWMNLPRDGGVAYAAQESWVLNETIKENIIFGTPYDEGRYKTVLYQCALVRDLSLFEAGDDTEVGEKGLTLSGGQKARVTLARAVYSSAKIILLDDVLAALDVHTSRWIVDKCFKGSLLRNRTVILVTHNIAMTSPIASFVVAMGADGRIASQGSVSDAIAQDAQLADELRRDKEAIEQDIQLSDDVIDDNTKAMAASEVKSGKLIMAEEVAEGHISWPSLKLFLGALGGKWPIIYWTAYILGQVLIEGVEAGQAWWLGWWARQYTLRHWTEVNAGFYLSIYCLFTVFQIMGFVYSIIIFTYGTLRVSRNIHRMLIRSLLGSTFRWLDTTPTSRIITRCTQDIQSVDGPTPMNFVYVFDTTLAVFAKIAAVMVVSPVFVFPAIFMGTIAYVIGQMYIKATMSVKREMSNAKAPVLASFSGATSGLTSIRAYGAHDMFRQQSRLRIDRYTRLNRTFMSLSRWISIRIDILNGLFSGSLAAYLVYGPTKVSPSSIGFSLNQAVFLAQYVVYWIQFMNEFEIEANSLERIRSYLDVDQEPKPIEGGVPPAYWPASGDLRVEKLSARYSPDGPKVLQDISFRVKAGERVGVVGRTGSGKSSLTLALLRCIYTEGSVYYDGLSTQSLNLNSLRSNVTIIPQVPELMSGTLRQNLDMFSQYDDPTLNNALPAAGLTALHDDADENRLTLESSISGGGDNLSVGQRQIVALARAIVRQSKLLILDEATSAIDYDTDNVIQSCLRKELKSDVTVITVAHRLQTIMDSDKIMVLDAGRLVEFASPKELLENETSFLRALVDESADKEALFAMANSNS